LPEGVTTGGARLKQSLDYPKPSLGSCGEPLYPLMTLLEAPSNAVYVLIAPSTKPAPPEAFQDITTYLLFVRGSATVRVIADDSLKTWEIGIHGGNPWALATIDPEHYFQVQNADPAARLEYIMICSPAYEHDKLRFLAEVDAHAKGWGFVY
jgi:hypothetical protein